MLAASMAWLRMLVAVTTTATALPSSRGSGQGASLEAAAQARLHALFKREFDFVWRTARRLGVPTDQLDDAVQQVFFVVSRRVHDIEPDKERSFLFGCARRVAADMRRKRSRREVASNLVDDAPARSAQHLSTVPPPVDDAGELLDKKRARELLDEVLDSMPDGVREVFTLFELEDMTMAEVAEAMDLPPGTVASRIRKARATFKAVAERLQAREAHAGGAHE